jgi:hypothetical protein
MVKRSEKTFISFRFEAKRNYRKRNEMIGSETKNFCNRNKAKKALLISLWSEAENSKRKEAKKNVFFT